MGEAACVQGMSEVPFGDFGGELEVGATIEERPLERSLAGARRAGDDEDRAAARCRAPTG